MSRKRLRSVAVAASAVVLIAGCGGTGTPHSPTAPSGPIATTTTRESSTKTNYDSARYCQQLENGKWVTNDRPSSTTACVPDPSYATGDEAVDASSVIPRCLRCKLSDWHRAEARMARSAADADAHKTTDPDDRSEWLLMGRSRLLGACTTSWGGNLGVCRCLVDRVMQQIPANEAAGLSPNDPGIRAAAIACGEADPEP